MLLSGAKISSLSAGQAGQQVRIAAVSLEVDPKERTLGRLLERISEAGREGVALVCFPRNSVAADPEPIPGPISKAVAARAKEARVEVVVNIAEKEGTRVFQTSFLCDRAGNLAGKYRQTHRMPDERLDLGDDLPVFNRDYGNVALKSGTDQFFPEIDRVYGFKGATLVVWSSEPEPLEDEHTTDAAFRGRAINTGIYFACARLAGKKEFQPSNYDNRILGSPLGRAMIVDRFGHSLAESGYEGGMAIASLPLDRWRGVGCGIQEPNKQGVFAPIVQKDLRAAPLPKFEPARRKVRVAVLDGNPGGGGRIDSILTRLDEVGKAGTDVACLYEYVWVNKRDPKEEEEGRKRLAQVADKARQWNMYVVLGGVLDKRERNDGVLIGRDGKEVGRYHKIYKTHEEQITGTELPVFDTDFGRVAIRICADEWCPEIDEIYALKGAEILFNPTQSYSPTAEFREIREMGRAIDNGFWIVSSTHGLSQTNQRSFVLDPLGVFVARGEYWKMGFLRAVIDLDNRPYRFRRETEDVKVDGYMAEYQSAKRPRRSRDLREAVFSMRRPELYGVLSPVVQK
jgi:predicted amidohydrolase